MKKLIILALVAIALYAMAEGSDDQIKDDSGGIVPGVSIPGVM